MATPASPDVDPSPTRCVTPSIWYLTWTHAPPVFALPQVPTHLDDGDDGHTLAHPPLGAGVPVDGGHNPEHDQRGPSDQEAECHSPHRPPPLRIVLAPTGSQRPWWSCSPGTS
ncbi:hypothetical protein [Dactylosporangium sp. NPDC049140]|uniref:hypothetical protein n=1 Tax=Dactylosporangium sp. NPDC049140 TaxID=3155647 RepID=UPI0033E0527D